MGSFSPEIGLQLQTPGDPAVAGVWGTNLNKNFSLIDSAVAGLLSLSVAGASNVVLTATQGVANQARNKIFSFTGALTGNVDVLWPQNVTGVFVVQNLTTGSHTLALGVNNGSGSPDGSTVTIAQNEIVVVYSDGTNIVLVTGAGPIVSGGFSCTLTVSANTNVTLPPSGNVPSVTVSSSPPSGNPGIVGALWFQT